MYRVTVSLGGKVVRKHPFDQDKVVVGRDDDCDITIDNVAVSRNHCTINRDGSTFTLEDLHSGNGTFFNGEKIQEQELSSGDAFVIGKYTLLFETVTDAEDVVKQAAAVAGGEDATFRLDRAELDKLIGKASRAPGDSRAILIPEKGGPPVPLTQPYIFAGSSTDSTIPASGFMVTPRFALFIKEETGHIRLVRVGGKMGTLTVNNQPADTRVLRKGDIIDICGSRFKYDEE